MFGADDLNASQLAAVHHPGGPLLLLAGAGSGKTRVITYRLAELLRRGVDPERILAVTFTNKAAGELRLRTDRLLQQLGLTAVSTLPGAPRPSDPNRSPVPRWIGTFHAIGARLLRRLATRAGLPSDFVILDDDDQLKICKELCQAENLSELAMPPRALRSAFDRAKNQCLLPADYKGRDYFTDLVAKLYPRYQERLKQLGAADFGDLLMLPVVLCDQDPELRAALGRRFQHVLVDEFQDVNQVQYRLLMHLSSGYRNLVVVGDDDQAIYGWRGADVRLLLDFEADWPDAQVVKLEENYRSSQIILDAAHAVVTKNPSRRDKRLYTKREGGELILSHEALDERHEAAFIVQTVLYLQAEHGYLPADFAIIYRTNAQSRVIEEALRQSDVPYTVVGGTRFYDRAEVKDILAYLRLCNNPADELALRRVINVPARGIGTSTLAKLEAQARITGIPLWQALENAVSDDELLGSGPRKKLQAFIDLINALRSLVGTVSLTELAKQVLARTGYLNMLRPDEPEDQSRRENVLELIGSIEDQERREAEGGGQREMDVLDAELMTAAAPVIEVEVEIDGAEVQAAPEPMPAPMPPPVSGPPPRTPRGPRLLPGISAHPGPGAGQTQPPPEPTVDEIPLVAAPPPLSLAQYLERVALQMGDDDHPYGKGVLLMTAHAAKGLEFQVVLVTGLEDGLFPSLRTNSDSEAERDARLAEERRLAYVALTRAKERLILTHAHTRRLYGQQPRIAPPSRFLREIPSECLAQTVEAEPEAYRGSDYGGFRRLGGRPAPRRPVPDDGELHVERDDEPFPDAPPIPRRRRPDGPAAGAPSSGLHVEYDDGGGAGSGSGSGPRLRVGQPVRHPQLGVGRVESLSERHLGVMATVRFGDGPPRTIQAKFLQPVREPLGGEAQDGD